MPWTKEQQQVIDSRKRNLLVSAAAGSGKTAVLVERITAMILDKENPLDIDRLLVVTFTNAAAAEMRERIGKAIEKALEEDPANEHLVKQVSGIHQANITTIDSYCLHLVKDHFHRLNLDPAFRIGEEAELSLLKQDTLNQVMEECYQEGSRDFIQLVESYSQGKSDSHIGEMILELFQVARSNPQPKRWLQQCREHLLVESMEQLDEQAVVQLLKHHLHMLIDEVYEELKKAKEVCAEPDGPMQYDPAITADLLQVIQLRQCDTLEQWCQFFLEKPTFTRLSGKKNAEVDERKKASVQNSHEFHKSVMKDCYERYFRQSPEEILKDLQQAAAPLRGLIHATERFMDCYQENKLEQNVLNFDDVEHFALQLLVDFDDNGKPCPSDIARETGEWFHEVIVDEYQDINYIQEAILTSLSQINQGNYNMFMVGDVKQSIYKFRQAKPEIFMEKYHDYTMEESLCQRIELRKNFRSRGQVLESINYIFYQIMRKEIGGIEYNDQIALYPGREPEDRDRFINDKTELWLLDVAEDNDDSLIEEYSKVELEATMIAQRIHELVDGEEPHYVYDKDMDQYRKAEYRDIVILLRAATGWAERIESILATEGIPSYSDSQKGYFNTTEIRTMLNLLSIIDNPYQNIPFVSVMRSPIGGFNGEELAILKIYAKEQPKKIEYFYSAMVAYEKEYPDQVFSTKIKKFLFMLEQMQQAKTYMDLRSLLWFALNETGYYHMIGAMPNGKQRQGNMLMLVQQAETYESTNYKGLFRFLQYMNQLQEYNVDYGEARELGEGQNLVRIMSIHKSKGLEFPIVFVSGLHKKFNMKDTEGKVIIHPDYCLGADVVDPVLRTKDVTLIKSVLKTQMEVENLGEELRILYVALTRAREKLILTGVVNNYKKQMDSYMGVRYSDKQKIDYSVLVTGRKYLDWILASLAREKKELFDIHIVPLFSLVMKETEGIIQTAISKEEFLQWKPYVEESKREEIKNQIRWKYDHTEETVEKGKFSVSELKVMGQQMDDPDTEPLIAFTDFRPTVPSFREGVQEYAGARKGTVVHSFMEMLDFHKVLALQDVQDAVSQMIDKGFLTKEEEAYINPTAVLKFIYSDLGSRAAKAAEQGELYKEVQYMAGIPGKELKPDCTVDELVLIQGIIDGYFVENDEIVLFDYKTDHVNPGEEQTLVQKYKTQLDLYERALEMMTGKKVKEKYLYSFCLHKAIRVESISSKIVESFF